LCLWQDSIPWWEHGRGSQFTSWLGRKRERKRRGWGPHTPFKGMTFDQKTTFSTLPLKISTIYPKQQAEDEPLTHGPLGIHFRYKLQHPLNSHFELTTPNATLFTVFREVMEIKLDHQGGALI
jgi:hypothetical protein